eukprot:Lankesteria_metandrocarpae@DN5492_c0_g1_i10.p2
MKAFPIPALNVFLLLVGITLLFTSDVMAVNNIGSRESVVVATPVAHGEHLQLPLNDEPLKDAQRRSSSITGSGCTSEASTGDYCPFSDIDDDTWSYYPNGDDSGGDSGDERGRYSGRVVRGVGRYMQLRGTSSEDLSGDEVPVNKRLHGTKLRCGIKNCGSVSSSSTDWSSVSGSSSDDNFKPSEPRQLRRVYPSRPIRVVRDEATTPVNTVTGDAATYTTREGAFSNSETTPTNSNYDVAEKIIQKFFGGPHKGCSVGEPTRGRPRTRTRKYKHQDKWNLAKVVLPAPSSSGSEDEEMPSGNNRAEERKKRRRKRRTIVGKFPLNGSPLNGSEQPRSHKANGGVVDGTAVEPELPSGDELTIF